MGEGNSRTWWQRNKSWAAPVGCVTLAVGLGCFALLAVAGAGLMRCGQEQLAAYGELRHEVEAEVLAHPRVQAELGQPLALGAAEHQSYAWRNGVAHAELRMRVSGPRGEGQVEVQAARPQDTWQLLQLQLRVGDRAPVDLLGSGSELPGDFDF